MSYASDDDPVPPTCSFLLPAAGMVASFAYLAFGAGFESEFASIGVLIAFPFCLGMLLTLSSRMYSPLGCLGAPVLLAAASYALVKLGIEGMICVVMVMPVWFVLGLGGGLAALYLRWLGRQRGDGGGTTTRSVGLAVLPFALIALEGQVPPSGESRTVTRSVVVDAAPQEVWPLLVSIPGVMPDEGRWTATHDLLGVPRPSEARLVERGGTAVREARWGKHVRFEEVVTRIDPGKAIAWRFAFPDDSVQRHTDRHIAPDGELLKVTGGGYTLAPLANGATRVTLHTQYSMRTRFGWYFGWWGERLLGDVEDNVLTIIRDRAEARG